MPLLAPPEKEPARTREVVPAFARPDERSWKERISRSGYFLGALLFHLLVLLIVATWVVFQTPPPPVEPGTAYVPPSSPPPPPPPATSKPTMQVSTKAAALPQTIVANTAVPTFTVPMPEINVATDMPKLMPTMMTTSARMPGLASRLPGIMATEKKWGRSKENIEDSNGDPHNVIARFPVYLAQYANGDWNCNVFLDDSGNIKAGSLPDLVAKINEWSKGNIKGDVVPTPLDIGGPDLMAKMPPFIFFTGHKDFTLTDQEIANLRQYLQNGGAIWGDNSLPGYGSRFDVAFRREMKRVLPDADKNFEPLPLTHDVFKKSWFALTDLPTGMNFYDEPIQHIDIDGKLAVIYTPNDYGDLYLMRILPGDETMEGELPVPPSPLFTYAVYLENSKVFFRNFTLPSCLQAHKLGMNIIGFLLVRFDKDLLLTP